MNTKLIIALAAMLALVHVNAQVPALESLSSKIESIETSVTGSNKTPLLSSASSAYSRISEAIASSAATASSTVSSQASSASSVSSSAASAQSSASSVLGSATSSASALAQTDSASNAGNVLIGDNNYAAQLSALTGVFIASFLAMLA